MQEMCSFDERIVHKSGSTRVFALLNLENFIHKTVWDARFTKRELEMLLYEFDDLKCKLKIQFIQQLRTRIYII